MGETAMRLRKEISRIWSESNRFITYGSYQEGNEEIVIGVASRFWHPNGGRCLELTADGFSGFSRPALAKAAWNFKLRAESPRSAVLSTETRSKCFGSAAFWKFRLYGSAVGPFSGLMPKAILKRVKTDAE
jgi:hypothetical protein